MQPPNLPPNLKDPRLTLFAFHLLHDITQKPQDGAKGADRLWKQVAGLGDILEVNLLKHLPGLLKSAERQIADPSIYQELFHPNPFLPFYSHSSSERPKLTGEVYPVQIHDTYGLDLTLHYSDISQPIACDRLSELNPKGCLLPQFIQAELGQTLLLFAQPEAIPDDPATLADRCVAALLQNTDYILVQDSTNRAKNSVGRVAGGQLFKGPIFEYQTINAESTNPSNNCHILVWFNYHPQTATKAGQAYRDLLQLLCYRAKICHQAYQSQFFVDCAREEYIKLEQKINFFDQLLIPTNKQLENLKKLINELPVLAFKLSYYRRNIEDCRTTIAANAKNFDARLADIRKLTLPPDNLDFWENFRKLECKNYLKQIDVNLQYLEGGQKLFDQAIATIRGIAELEQTERDRNIDRNIAIFGFGIGAAGVVASGSASYAGVIQEISPVNNYVSFWQLNDAQAHLVVTINFSLLAGAVASLITAGVIATFKNSKFTHSSPKLPP
ncbi:hypothetical protein [Laspinema olomoucense]|uniref:hypothetical protein n=1 Tax=Laspinema olomoucense TaxID=3231600 RepID=UPI0021BA7713|nr:hypothetical protein [Laspinema sp. D3d]MCT7973414.1 hypothetical protein [Laspinema sp. D3d]